MLDRAKVIWSGSTVALKPKTWKYPINDHTLNASFQPVLLEESEMYG